MIRTNLFFCHAQTCTASTRCSGNLARSAGAAANFAALKPWEFTYDSDVVGLKDPVTGETRIGCVLGAAGNIFGAVFYRRPAGLRWMLQMFNEAPDPEDLDAADGMDCLKLEFVPKHELCKEDLTMLKAAGFKPSLKPAGKAAHWRQFRSAEPGWLPWHINQTEAHQLLADLPRLTAFCKIFQEHPEIFDGCDPSEIPFVPVALPERALTPGDLDWRPLLPLPVTGLDPFRPAAEQLEKLRALKRRPGLVCEFDTSLLPGGTFLENRRPCFGRFGLLVETQRGLVVGMSVQSGALSPGEAAGHSLVESLLKAGTLPEKIHVGGSLYQPVLQPLCDKLEIQLWPQSSLPALEEAVESLSQSMMAGPR